jgi:acetyl esterase/lipase
MSEIEAVRAMLRQLVNREGPAPELPELRVMYDAWGESYPLAEGARAETASLGGVSALKVTTPAARADRALLYLHGGGYAIGSIRSHRHLVAQLSQASGLTGYGLDYRLAPETAFPGAVDDAVAAYRALIAAGIAPEKIVIAGDSAGGGLTAATGLALKTLGLPQPAGLFCISPWSDLSQTGASYAANAENDLLVNKPTLDTWSALYLAGRDTAHPLASPVYGDFAGLAPMLIHVGSDEVLLSDSIRLAEAAGTARVPVELVIAPDMPHVWHFMWAQLTPAREAIASAGAWMQARIG